MAFCKFVAFLTDLAFVHRVWNLFQSLLARKIQTVWSSDTLSSGIYQTFDSAPWWTDRAVQREIAALSSWLISFSCFILSVHVIHFKQWPVGAMNMGCTCPECFFYWLWEVPSPQLWRGCSMVRHLSSFSPISEISHVKSCENKVSSFHFLTFLPCLKWWQQGVQISSSPRFSHFISGENKVSIFNFLSFIPC